MLTTVFFREATFRSLHETLESLGAEMQSRDVGESTWALQTSDGAHLRLHVIGDFDGYSKEIVLDELLKLAPAYAALGQTPRVTLQVGALPIQEGAARQLENDVLALHPGVSHHDADPGKPLAEAEREEAMKKMGWSGGMR